MPTMTTVAEGRIKFERVLARECERAKEDLESALSQAKAGIERAQALLADGMGVPTTVSGEGMILGHEGSRVDELAGKWMAAEQRRAHLLGLYDEVNA